MTATVEQFIGILERLAPPRLAESWDRIGLQIGSRSWPVSKVWTALDPLPEVVAKACENDVDLLITHHPLFFKPLHCIDGATPLGRIAAMALSRKLSIYSAHTNLDSVQGGVNDVLAGRMGLGAIRPLGGSGDGDGCKLALFVPSSHEKAILDALFDLNTGLNIGKIGNYACCTFRCAGVGTFLPGEHANPAVGKSGALTEVLESRIEIRVSRTDLDMVVDALKKVHPYETMAYDVYPLSRHDLGTGLGRVGELPSPLALDALARRLKTALRLQTVKVTGEPDLQVKTVALCSGSGSSLFHAAVASGAQVYVSGDLGYHTARDAQLAGIGLIDVGHFGSEHLIVDVLAESIRGAIATAGITAIVEAAATERDPFHYL